MILKNYTTIKNYRTTIQEIETYLSKMGAKRILKEYDGRGIVTSLSFEINYNEKLLPIKLPARIDRVPAALRSIYNTDKELTSTQKALVKKAMGDEQRAINIAWRIIKDWLEANMSIMQLDQINMLEALLPFVVMKNGKTFYELLEHNNFEFKKVGAFLLEDGRKE